MKVTYYLSLLSLFLLSVSAERGRHVPQEIQEMDLSAHFSSEKEIADAVASVQEIYSSTAGNQTLATLMLKGLIYNQRLREEEERSAPPRVRRQQPDLNCADDDTCDDDGNMPTNTVRNLKLCDIEIVAAIGDSITAAMGAKSTSLFNLLTEYRGISFAMGGDEGVVTLPNLLRQYNANLTGFSLGTGSQSSGAAHFNQAVSGAHTYDLMGQGQHLLSVMQDELSESDFEEKWKMITLFIGGNDVCQYCDSNPHRDPGADYLQYVREVLEFFRDNFPKTMVNLLPMLNIQHIQKLAKEPGCSFTLDYACPCSLRQSNNEDLEGFYQAFQDAACELETDRTLQRPDFKVVVQPFVSGFAPPMREGGAHIDLTYFAPDCFHFSARGHEVAARGLWNNLLESFGEKETIMDYDAGDFRCPGQMFEIPTRDPQDDECM